MAAIDAIVLLLIAAFDLMLIHRLRRNRRERLREDRMAWSLRVAVKRETDLTNPESEAAGNLPQEFPLGKLWGHQL